MTLRLSRSFCSGTCSVFFPLLWQNPLARLPSLHPVEPGCVLENLTYASLKTFSPRTARSGQLSARTQLAERKALPGCPWECVLGVSHPAEGAVGEISEALVVPLGLHR